MYICFKANRTPTAGVGDRLDVSVHVPELWTESEQTDSSCPSVSVTAQRIFTQDAILILC